MKKPVIIIIAVVILVLVLGGVALANTRAKNQCASRSGALTRAISTYRAGDPNFEPTAMDAATIQKLIDDGYVKATSADELQCPSGGTYSLSGTTVVCSKHK
jgi:hypothetical protein